MDLSVFGSYSLFKVYNCKLSHLVLLPQMFSLWTIWRWIPQADIYLPVAVQNSPEKFKHFAIRLTI